MFSKQHYDEFAKIFKNSNSLPEVIKKSIDLFTKDNPNFDKETFKKAAMPVNFENKVAGCKDLDKQIYALRHKGDVKAGMSGDIRSPPHLEKLRELQQTFIERKCSNYLE